MLKYLEKYKHVKRFVFLLALAELCIQFSHVSFYLLVNFFLMDYGFGESEIADIWSTRFIIVLLVAFPLGLFIKGRKLKPFFYIATIGAPIFTFLFIYAVTINLLSLVYFSIAGYALSFICIQVTSIPFVLNNADKETHSESIALFFQTWSAATFICGVSSFFLLKYLPDVIDEKVLLIGFGGFGLLGSAFIFMMNVDEKVSKKIPLSQVLNKYDWVLIAKALIPTMIIAIGAGFTIPFINLFFLTVHGIESDWFSLMGATTYLMVAFGVLFIPGIKRRFGYQVAITLIQSLSIVALVIMATTEFYNHLWFAVYIAVTFYLVRQPLMNLAGPMTTELTMYYVSKRNQEIVSALSISIWSGSWAFSSQIFKVMRNADFTYGAIFLVTAGLYVIGVAWYYYLILEYNKKVSSSKLRTLNLKPETNPYDPHRPRI